MYLVFLQSCSSVTSSTYSLQISVWGCFSDGCSRCCTVSLQLCSGGKAGVRLWGSSEAARPTFCCVPWWRYGGACHLSEDKKQNPERLMSGSLHLIIKWKKNKQLFRLVIFILHHRLTDDITHHITLSIADTLAPLSSSSSTISMFLIFVALISGVSPS